MLKDTPAKGVEAGLLNQQLEVRVLPGVPHLIEEYIQLPKEQRQRHLELSNACSLIGGDSRAFKGLLAYYLGTTIPTGQRKIHLCHACNAGGCSNVKHLYWGSAKENLQDQINCGRFKGPENLIIARLNRKSQKGKPGKPIFSKEKWNEIYAVLDSIPKTWGWIQKAAAELNVSHTQVRRYLKRRRKNETSN